MRLDNLLKSLIGNRGLKTPSRRQPDLLAINPQKVQKARDKFEAAYPGLSLKARQKKGVSFPTSKELFTDHLSVSS
jgi:hypothetical protein